MANIINRICLTLTQLEKLIITHHEYKKDSERQCIGHIAPKCLEKLWPYSDVSLPNEVKRS